jgi:hypothetical protein
LVWAGKGLDCTARGVVEVFVVDHEYYRDGRLTVTTTEAPPAMIAGGASDLQ